MYSLDQSNYFTRTTLPLSLARGGIARVVALLFIHLLVFSSISFCQTSGDLVTASNSVFQDGAVSIGYLQNGIYVPYNTPFTVCKGVVGWCLDKCPGVEGDVTLNTTKEPITLNGHTWQPGILYANPGFESNAVVVRFKPSKSQSFSCVASFSAKPDSGDAVAVRISKNSTDVKTTTVDTAQKQDSTVLSDVSQAGPSDTLYFVVGNIEHERSGLVGVQLFVTPDAAKVDPVGSIKPAFVGGKK